MRVLLAALLLAGCSAQLLDKPEDATAAGGSAKARPEPADATTAKAAKRAAKRAAKKAKHKAIQQMYKEAYAPLGYQNHKKGGKGSKDEVQEQYKQMTQMYGAMFTGQLASMPDAKLMSEKSNMTDADVERQHFIDTERAKRQYFMNKWVPGAYRPTVATGQSGSQDQVLNDKQIRENYKQKYAPSKEVLSGHQSKMTDDKHVAQVAAEPEPQPHRASSASSGVESSAVPTAAFHASPPSEDKASNTQSVAVATNLGEQALAGISSWRFTLGLAAGFCLPAAFVFLKSTRRAAMATRLPDRTVEESQFHLLA